MVYLDIATDTTKRLLRLVQIIVWLVLLAILVACRQELAETPGVQTITRFPIIGSTTANVPAESTREPPATLSENVSTPPEPTAQPTSTKELGTVSTPQVTPNPNLPGALIQVSMKSQVGVLLDEIPAEIRDQITKDILEESEEFWLARAQRQVRLTRNRLNYRNFIYDGKGQLPLPPEELWSISLDPTKAKRQTIQGHDLVMVDYTFTSTLLTGIDSPGQAEPALAEVGGVWQEPFIFPADPDLLLQRTGNSCVNEGGFPPNSFDSENVWIFYDYACEADSAGAAGCHRTRLPRLSCREALEERVGEVEATIRFERITWDSNVADAVRVGSVANLESPDLLVIGEDLDTNRVIYRFIGPKECALDEGSVGGIGWRRLLQFNATVANIGGQPLDIGPVVAEDPVNHIYSYSPCHDHFHFSNYGDFSLGTPDKTQSSKRAFCVQSTNRFSNNETTPLTHNYSCQSQGIQAGWVDEYVAGLDSQWIDITDMDFPSAGLSIELTFSSNSDQFLCEGAAVLDEDGEPVWEPSGFTTADGDSINRPQCEFIADWDVNNRAARDVLLEQSGSFVTEPCTNRMISPVRNCGFEVLLDTDPACIPGTTVKRAFRLEDSADLQVMRVCETSSLLGTGLACTFEESLANVIISNDPSEVSFVCPQIRDSEESAGGYSLYSAPLWPMDASQAVVPVEE